MDNHYFICGIITFFVAALFWIGVWAFDYRSVRVVESVEKRGTGEYYIDYAGYKFGPDYEIIEIWPKILERKEYVIRSVDGFEVVYKHLPTLDTKKGKRLAAFWR